jgi:hypothetical protein
MRVVVGANGVLLGRAAPATVDIAREAIVTVGPVTVVPATVVPATVVPAKVAPAKVVIVRADSGKAPGAGRLAPR